jgi:hypothetical protein
MTTLSNEEKLTIVNSKLKNLNYNKFSLGVDKISENAKASPDADTVSRLNSLISETDRQIAALTTEAALYTTEEE